MKKLLALAFLLAAPVAMAQCTSPLSVVKVFEYEIDMAAADQMLSDDTRLTTVVCAIELWNRDETATVWMTVPTKERGEGSWTLKAAVASSATRNQIEVPPNTRMYLDYFNFNTFNAISDEDATPLRISALTTP